MVGVALKVMGEPAQTGAGELIITEGATAALLFTVNALLVTVAGEAQAALLVILTLTWSPVASVEEVKEAPVCPAMGEPFSSH